MASRSRPDAATMHAERGREGPGAEALRGEGLVRKRAA